MQDRGIDVGSSRPPAVIAPRTQSRPRDFGRIGFTATPKPPARPHVQQSYGGPSTPRYSSGRQIGSNNVGRISSIAPPAPPPPPKPPSINEWLAGDTAYKQQTDASQKALRDYLAQMTGQQNNYNTEYERNLGNLGDAEKLATTDTENDFSARGLTTSGLYLKALADLKADYDKRESTLADGRAEFLGNLQNGLTNFKSTQGINNTRYRNEAINRRAAQYGS